MKRLAKILSFICLCALVCAAASVARRLPADNSAYVEKKYAGWNGVLRGWVCCEWNCAGSFISWLNGAAADFEKQHDGVYLEFETVTPGTIAALDSIRPPDILLCSDGVHSGTPVALGGYVFVENPGAAGTAVPEEYAAPLIAMYEEASIDAPDAGLDLGLPVMNAAGTIAIDPDAFPRFINGGLGRTVVNQAQLAKLIALRESGRGPDWTCKAQGRYHWQDQRLLFHILQTQPEQSALCRDFLKLLLDDEHQSALADIGAFPATGISAHSSFSPYREMESQLQMTTPILPKHEHSFSDFAAIVRKLSAGEISARAASEYLAQTCS